MIDAEYPFLVSSATSRASATSSLAISPKDASLKNAVATGTYSSVECSKKTKRVDEILNLGHGMMTFQGDEGEFDLGDQPCCDTHFLCTGDSSVHRPIMVLVLACAAPWLCTPSAQGAEKEEDCTIYGIASDGYTFVFLKIDNGSKPSSHPESNKPPMSPQSRDTDIILLHDNVYHELASSLYGGVTEVQTPLQPAGWRDAAAGLGDVLATVPHSIPPAVRPIALALHVESTGCGYRSPAGFPQLLPTTWGLPSVPPTGATCTPRFASYELGTSAALSLERSVSDMGIEAEDLHV
ncbi:hypothetical protein PENFLA_c026G05504 [Penicillium flavigenum]|uniref:Uncharacterized protein n=1 Tax=Penicillium flavigenum TaxID=254877 RepID=A0A1V6ST61_9EURO|nr:hypothetical protein PENFLA_c026G05504 [Penicillium flavigenum]